VVSAWSDFFTAQVTAFAALTGLVFVALSINLRHVVAVAGLAGRAGEAVVLLLAPVLTGFFGLIPGQGVRSLGAAVLAVGLVEWALLNRILLASRASLRERPAKERASRLVLVEAATLLLVGGGAALGAGSASGFDLLVAGVSVSLVAGMVDAWVLLVEILR